MPELRAELDDWADALWLRILDRNGGTGGRVSDNGVLQRFDPRIDTEYHLDLLSSQFLFAEREEWWKAANGFRWRAGSISKRDLAMHAEIKNTVPLDSAWSLGFRVDLEDTPEARRRFVRVHVSRRLGREFSASLEASLDPTKSGSDLAATIHWQHPTAPYLRAEATLAVLDWPTNLIYINLHAARAFPVDSSLVYEGQPLAARGAVTIPLTSSLHLVGHGAIVRPNAIDSYKGEMPDSGFRLFERVGYVGAMLQWTPTRAASVGVIATVVRARSDRSRLAPAVPVDEYTLLERTARIGGLMAIRLSQRWLVDAQFTREWRRESRTDLTVPSKSVEYEEHGWWGSLMAGYRQSHGFVADVGVQFDLRDVPSGAGELAGTSSLGGHHYRARADMGWRFGPAFVVLLGSAFDLDGDGGATRFDGARGRFAIYW